MRNLGIFLFHNMELLDFAGPYEVFSVTSELNDYKLFKVFTVTEKVEPVRTVNGLAVLPDHSIGDHPFIDVLVIPGGVGIRKELRKANILEWIKPVMEGSEITMSVCSGAMLLARAGVLANLPFTTHHEVIHDLLELDSTARFIEDARFVDNGKFLTAGGISAGIDLSLHVVARLYGQEVADRTALYMEYGNWKEKITS
ncbi:MAG: DJ-1/PfpI family protein [Synergistales bacterium]|nr:DJ-1/PfpI family protein [Synergistales bacterium]